MSEVKELHRALWELLGRKLTKSEVPSQETLELNAGRHIRVSLVKWGQRGHSQQREFLAEGILSRGHPMAKGTQTWNIVECVGGSEGFGAAGYEAGVATGAEAG